MQKIRLSKKIKARSPVEISICIVAYKSDQQLQKCLHAISLSKVRISYEIIVIDNNETHSKVLQITKKYNNVRYIKARRNGGYGAGNNLALSNAIGKYVLVLNPDVIVESDTIQKLYEFLKKHPRAAAVGTAYQTTNGHLVPLGTGELTPLRGVFSLSFLNKLFPQNPFSKGYYVSRELREKPTQVWAVAGSIALFRKQALIDAGSYDEKLFLYYEESDLGRRLIKNGWQVWITNSTAVIHAVGKSTENVDKAKIKKIFIESRQHYFKKHFGLLNSLVVEAFARFGKWEALLLVIVIGGSFLRFFRLQENIVFHGELGDNYLAIKNILMTGDIPLLGPPTSHPWLSFGPLYYWLFVPILLVSKYNPIGVSYTFASLHSILIIVNYLFIKNIFNKKIALMSTFIIAISPVFVGFAHESRFFSLVLLLFYPFFYFLVNKKYFMSGFMFAILLNFHLTPLVYIPPIFILAYGSVRRMVRVITVFCAGTVLGSIPFVFYSVTHDFEMIKNALMWIPYRIGGFLGLVPKNNINQTVAAANVGSGIEFLKSLFVPPSTSGVVITTLLIAIFGCAVYGLLKAYSEYRYNVSVLTLFLLLGYIAIFIHGEPPIHYYLPLYPVIVVLVAVGLSKIRNVSLVLLFFAILTIINLSFYFSPQWFYQDQTRVSIYRSVPFQLQVKASQSIISDSKGQKFSLWRVGPYDQFEKDYSQNFIYLLWKEGNEPVFGSSLIYTVYETDTIHPSETIIFSEGGLTVTKKYEIDPVIT